MADKLSNTLSDHIANLIKTVDVRLTTESNGNLTIPSNVITTSNLLLACIPNRAVAYGTVYTAAISTNANHTQYLLNCKNADGSVVASQEVVLTLVYV